MSPESPRSRASPASSAGRAPWPSIRSATSRVSKRSKRARPPSRASTSRATPIRASAFPIASAWARPPRRRFMQTPFRLDGKKALVTGGASGIGEATCRVLTQAGASVVIADVDRARAEALSAELPGSSVLQVDITNESAVQGAFESPAPLDILVNNAGIGLVGGIEETELVDFERLFQVNVTGLFLVTRAAMPKLLASKGSVVNIGSVA